MYISIKHIRGAMAWKRVAAKGSIKSGKSSDFRVNGKRITVINNGGWYAVDAMCVHQEKPITAGKIEGDVIECPHHFWHYNYKTGELLDYLKDIKLETFKVEERDDGIYLDV
ncbi:dioxygenase ferredoxin protein [Cenarchaeum symbiosum A]|uniref:Dioxygenase ferredoxin protein n=1 Tax=Cenarchaeum symbiosum (strain A) TaxID=414004 RepID=A0RXE7_CENSY|nr:dioxygenase ferredoxin protein [Cenarchaeum symbiosum A]